MIDQETLNEYGHLTVAEFIELKGREEIQRVQQQAEAYVAALRAKAEDAKMAMIHHYMAEREKQQH